MMNAMIVSLIGNLAAGAVLLVVGLAVVAVLVWALRPGGRAERARRSDRESR